MPSRCYTRPGYPARFILQVGADRKRILQEGIHCSALSSQFRQRERPQAKDIVSARERVAATLANIQTAASRHKKAVFFMHHTENWSRPFFSRLQTGRAARATRNPPAELVDWRGFMCTHTHTLPYSHTVSSLRLCSGAGLHFFSAFSAVSACQGADALLPEYISRYPAHQSLRNRAQRDP